MVAVNVAVTDGSIMSTPIPGAQVGIFDPVTYVLVGLGATDVHGVASFTMNGGEYELRVFKMGVAFSNPLRIQVIDDGTPNAFDVFGTIVGSFGVPSDPRLCRCVGRFVDYSNRPMANVMVRIATTMDLKSKQPKIVDNNFVQPSAMVLRTDSNGYLTADLLREGGYWVTFAGEDDELWDFIVPDRATANLTDLIHPYVVSHSWSAEGDTVSLTVGESVIVPFTVTFSDYQTRSTGLEELILFLNSDDSVVPVYHQSSGSVALTGKTPGSAIVTVESLPDLFPKRVPSPVLQATPLQVTVT